MYIRTKDGVYEVKVNKYHELVYKKDNQIILSKDIIKQADTIEELIDEYVVDNSLIEIFELYGELVYHDINDYETFCKFGKYHKFQDVHGAIWTDKGLIYVAKMNDRGKLELI